MIDKVQHNRFDSINSRVLVRNTHKLVYKKLCNINREIWCDKYLSIASSKIIDNKYKDKFIFSMQKKFNT
jgi:hypothetical protein